MKNLIYNNKGMTLIELLASITILGFVVIIFMGFFSQGMLFSTKVEDKLSSINVAEKVLNEAQNNDIEYTGESIVIDDLQYREVKSIELNGKFYYPYVSQTEEIPKNLHLNRIYVKIFTEKNGKSNPNSTPTSELFGYLELGEEK